MASFLFGAPAASPISPSPVGAVEKSQHGPIHDAGQRSPLQRERLLPLTEVVKHLPTRKGKRTHYSTVYRWATKGTRGRVLESCLVGGIRYTSHEALERFITHAHRGEHDDSQANAVEAALRLAGL